MANGTSRYALARIQLKRESGTTEMQEELERLSKKQPTKMPLKASANSNNKSRP